MRPSKARSKALRGPEWSRERAPPGRAALTPAAAEPLSAVRRQGPAALIVGAEGRMSTVREAAGITLHQDRPHHWFAGMLVEGAGGWDQDLQAIGTEDDFAFLAFPQGGDKVRLYGSYALEQKGRFGGPEGQRRFLDAFRLDCCPAGEAIAAGTPAACNTPRSIQASVGLNTVVSVCQSPSAGS